MLENVRTLARRRLEPRERHDDALLIRHLPYVTAVTDDVLMLRDGEIMATFAVDGIGATTAESVLVGDVADAVQAVVAQATPDFGFTLHRVSFVADARLKPPLDADPFSFEVDRRWQMALAAMELRERRSFLTVVLRPQKILGLSTRLFGAGVRASRDHLARRLERLNEAQRASLLALPEDEAELVRFWTLNANDLGLIVSRRRAHNRLGFAIQLCGLRYPGRLLRPSELIPHASLAFVGEQLGIEPQALADYASRGPTRYEQLDTLRDLFGFRPFCRPVQADLQAWLLPLALTTTNGAALARMLLYEFRRRRLIVPGITPVVRMVGKALFDAERHVVSHRG